MAMVHSRIKVKKKGNNANNASNANSANNANNASNTNNVSNAKANNVSNAKEMLAAEKEFLWLHYSADKDKDFFSFLPVRGRTRLKIEDIQYKREAKPKDWEKRLAYFKEIRKTNPDAKPEDYGCEFLVDDKKEQCLMVRKSNKYFRGAMKTTEIRDMFGKDPLEAKECQEKAEELLNRDDCRRECFVPANGMRTAKGREISDIMHYHNIVLPVKTLRNVTREEKTEGKPFVYLNVEDRTLATEFFAKELLETMRKDSVPLPNSIVWTGKTMYLWYTFDPVSYKLSGMYEGVVRFLSDLVNTEVTRVSDNIVEREVLGDLVEIKGEPDPKIEKEIRVMRARLGDTFNPGCYLADNDSEWAMSVKKKLAMETVYFKMDCSDLENPAALYPFPGTYCLDTAHFCDFAVLNKSKYSLFAMYKLIEEKREEEKEKYAVLTEAAGFPAAPDDVDDFEKKEKEEKEKKEGGNGQKRTVPKSNQSHVVDVMRNLLTMRDKKGTAVGIRDLACFYATCALRFLGCSFLTCQKTVLEMNHSISQPMDDGKLLGYISSCYYKTYTPTNETIIKKLGMTQYEQDILDFHPSIKTQKKAEAMAKAQAKIERNEKILEMALEGHTQVEIAKALGINQSTVSRVLKKMRTGVGEVRKKKEEDKEAKKEKDEESIEKIKIKKIKGKIIQFPLLQTREFYVKNSDGAYVDARTMEEITISQGLIDKHKEELLLQYAQKHADDIRMAQKDPMHWEEREKKIGNIQRQMRKIGEDPDTLFEEIRKHPGKLDEFLESEEIRLYIATEKQRTGEIPVIADPKDLPETPEKALIGKLKENETNLYKLYCELSAKGLDNDIFQKPDFKDLNEFDRDKLFMELREKFISSEVKKIWKRKNFLLREKIVDYKRIANSLAFRYGSEPWIPTDSSRGDGRPPGLTGVSDSVERDIPDEMKEVFFDSSWKPIPNGCANGRAG